MSLDAIRAIGQAEESAHLAVAQAQIQARAIIADAQKKAEEQYAAAQKEVANQTSQLLAEASARGRQAQSVARDTAQARCEQLRKEALNEMDKAVSIVVEKVVSG